MRLARALELTHNFVSTPDSLEGLDSLLDPFLVEQALKQSGVAEMKLAEQLIETTPDQIVDVVRSRILLTGVAA